MFLVAIGSLLNSVAAECLFTKQTQLTAFNGSRFFSVVKSEREK